MPLPAGTHIAFVLTTLDTGGAERQFAMLATGLLRRGHRVEMVCLGQASPLAEELGRAGIDVYVVGARSGRTLRDGWRLLYALAGTVRRWRRHKPDVVHGVLLHGYLFAAAAGRAAGVRVLAASRRSLGYFKAGRSWLLRLERLATGLTDVVIANSDAVRQDTIAGEGLAADKVRVIHNGLEFGAPAPDARVRIRQSLDVAPDAPVGIMVANLIHYKAHDVLLFAWHAVVRTHPDSSLWLVGEGPERARLERLADELGLQHHVRLLGSREDLPDLLAAADLLVHASREEGFCNAILEGMAAGLPVVATAVGGNPEAVEAGKTGLLVAPDDAVALGSAIVDVFGDRVRGREYGAAGQARVAAAFTRERMIAAYETLYAEVSAGKG